MEKIRWALRLHIPHTTSELAAPTMAASTILLNPLKHGFPLQPAALLVLFSVLLVSTLPLLISFYPNRASPGRKPKVPPSPPKLPLIGNLHQLLGGLPHHSLRALSRKHGPLMLLQLGQVPTLVVSSAEMAEQVMKAHDLDFASRPHTRAVAAIAPGGKAVGFAPYGEFWRQAKRICVVHLLNQNRVQGFRPARETEVARLVGNISELSSSGGGAAIDMSRILSSFTNSVICRATLGKSAVEESMTREVADLIAQTIAVIGGFQLDNFFPSLTWLGKFTGMDAELAQLARRWCTVLDTMVDDAAGRREAGEERGGFVDVLLSLHQGVATAATGFAPSRDEIKGLLLSLTAAGTDTSYLVLEEALAELVKNPKAMKKAQEEVRRVVQGKSAVAEDDVSQMSYLKAVVKEVLRLHPPAPLLLPRESRRTVQIEGYEIPTKTRVVINAWAIARDPKYWESPEEFQPERFLLNSIDFKGNDFRFIPFGAGRRICPGMHFAMATVELVLANLLYHFDWSLPKGTNGGNFDMDESPGLTIHKRSSLRLVAKRR